MIFVFDQAKTDDEERYEKADSSMISNWLNINEIEKGDFEKEKYQFIYFTNNMKKIWNERIALVLIKQNTNAIKPYKQLLYKFMKLYKSCCNNSISL